MLRELEGGVPAPLAKRQRCFSQNAVELMNTAVLEQEQQAMQDPRLWGAVVNGHADSFKRLVEQNPDVLHTVGAVGERPLHLLLLHGHNDLAEWVIDKDPSCILHTYEGSIFKGESCLHMAIATRSERMVRKLLETSRILGKDSLHKLLNFAATGRFFGREEPCYWGEFALGFAVCTNQHRIVSMLVEEFGDDLAKVDTHRNNALHLAVEHELPDMVDFILALWERWPNPHDSQSLTSSTNGKNLTPLCAAAKDGHCHVFNHLLEKSRRQKWTYGKIECIWLPLEGLDYIPMGEVYCAVDLIIQEGHSELLMLPLMQELLTLKWEKVAKDYFMQSFFTALLQAIFFSLTLIVPNQTSSPGLQGFHWMCRSCVFVLTCKKTQVELREMWGGFWKYFSFTNPAFFENFISFCFCSSFLLLQAMDFTELGWEDEVAAVAALSFWSYLLWFLRGFGHTGMLVNMVWEMLMGDVVQFFGVTSIFVVASSLSAFVINTAKIHRNLGTFFWLLISFLHGLISGFDSDQISTLSRRTGEQDDPPLCNKEKDDQPLRGMEMLLIGYSLLGSVLLLNILVAMMNNTFENVSKAAGERWNMERACIIRAIESERRDGTMDRYYVELNGQRYLQIQRIKEK